MQAKAILRSASVAPRKARLVSNLVRGMSVSRALEVLEFVDKKSAGLIAKVIGSAVANAKQNYDADVDSLVVDTIFVDEGPMLKRFLPRAMGRASPIRKKTSHITVIVSGA